MKIIHVSGNIATVEGGKNIILDGMKRPKPGEYIQVVGNVAVGLLSKSEGIKIRNLIKKMNLYEH